MTISRERWVFDPDKPICHNKPLANLEYLLLFGMMVCGKKASTTAPKVNSFIHDMVYPNERIFPVISVLDTESLVEILKKHKIGRYGSLSLGLKNLAAKIMNGSLNLKTCTTSELEKIPGIGLKTSRFFILYSRSSARVACLDTHIRQFLRENGVNIPNRPITSKKQYLHYEKIFLDFCDQRSMTPYELDLQQWLQRRGR